MEGLDGDVGADGVPDEKDLAERGGRLFGDAGGDVNDLVLEGEWRDGEGARAEGLGVVGVGEAKEVLGVDVVGFGASGAGLGLVEEGTQGGEEGRVVGDEAGVAGDEEDETFLAAGVVLVGRGEVN